MHGLDFSLPIFNTTAPKPVQPVQPSASVQKPEEEESSFFDDLLDVVNPLQHLPVIGTLYRAITGDKIGIPARIAGGGLYGGLMGLASSVADTLFEKITGKTVGDTVMAFLLGEDGPQAEPENIAANNAQPRANPTPLAPGSLPGTDLLDEALKGIQADLAMRARVAYSRSMILQPQELATS